MTSDSHELMQHHELCTQTNKGTDSLTDWLNSSLIFMDYKKDSEAHLTSALQRFSLSC